MKTHLLPGSILKYCSCLVAVMGIKTVTLSGLNIIYLERCIEYLCQYALHCMDRIWENPFSRHISKPNRVMPYDENISPETRFILIFLTL